MNAGKMQTRTAGMINDFTEYMRVKNEKLREQFSEQQAAVNGNTGGIFTGVCIWVDGLTNPSQLVRPACWNVRSPCSAFIGRCLSSKE